jgi:hypothetical protein
MLQLKLFDSLITPILVYSCEVWGFENKQGIEKMHLQYCKRILNLRSSTPNFVVFGEIGWGEVGKGKRVDVYLEVRKRRGHIFFE